MKTSKEEPDLGEEMINKIIKYIGKDMLKYVPAKFLPALISLVSLPIYTNIFSPDEYGIYSMVMSGVGLISNIVAGWLGHSALRFYDEFNDQKDKSTLFYSNIFGVLFFFYFIIFILFLLFKLIPFDLVWNENYILLTSLILLFTASTLKIVRKMLRGARFTTLYSLFSILLPGGKLLFVILLKNKLSFLGTTLLLLATVFIELIIIFIFFIKVKPNFNFKTLNKNLIIRMSKFGIPLMVNSLLAWILSVSDRYLIGLLKSSSDVGLYSISYSIGDKSLKLVFTTLMLAAYPIIIKAWNRNNKQHVEKLLSKLIKYFFILCIPIVAALFIIGPLLISVLAAEEYYQGYMVLPWVGLGVFMMGLSQYVHKIWELTENTKTIVMFNFIAATSNLLLNLILIPYFGFIAGGISTFISYSIYFLLALYFLKDFKLNLFNKNLLLIIISSLLMLMPVYYINQIMTTSLFSLIIIIISGAIFYFILLFLFGVIKKEVKTIFRKFFSVNT